MAQVSVTRRVAVVATADGVDDDWDYADGFEVRLASTDDRSAERWARDALENAPSAMRGLIAFAHRRVLRFELGPLDAPDHVLGWRIATAEPDEVRLTADGPVVRGVLVGQRITADSCELRTFVYFHRPVAKTVWRAVGPIHRRVAPYLLRRAADARV